MATHVRAYRFRMRPTKAQEEAMLRLAGACRWVWNWALARRKAYHSEHGRGIPVGQLSRELTSLKECPETAWLKEAHAQSLQQTLRDLDRAFKNFFGRRAGFPRFKSRKWALPSFRIPQYVKVSTGKVYVPKVGWLRTRQSRHVQGEIKSATFKRDTCGNWYVALAVAFVMPDVALPPVDPDRMVGMDVGLKDFLVLSNGERVEAPKFYRKAEKKLRRAQRAFCRRKKGGKRRGRARNRVARVRQKTANQRRDFLHKRSADVIRRFGGVCVEDLNVEGLARTKLAKSFNDAAHGEFRRQLEYKALWGRKHFVKVGRFYPSTKTCGACGAVNDKLTMADRQWACPGCGGVHDRDRNAAINIRAEGLRLLASSTVGHTGIYARGVLVRPRASGAADVEPRISCL